MAEILVADDDRSIRESIRDVLEDNGHEVRLARNGEEALDEYNRKRPDLMILDRMMPRKDGDAVLREIRARDKDVPILILSALDKLGDVVTGLDNGADHYLTKPLRTIELLAQVKAILRRIQPAAEAPKPVSFMFGAHTVDTRECTMRAPDGTVETLLPRELSLLWQFASNPGKAFPREELLVSICGLTRAAVEYAKDMGRPNRAIDNLVLTLRRKLGADADKIVKRFKIGYSYVP